jgi:hypothetical protein
LRLLAAWLLEQEAEEAVMESTAQYWKPLWETLERYWKPIREKREGAKRRSGTLHLAQAQSNRGRRGRKKDFVDAERLVKRLVARELTLSFVPDAEQRLWRTVLRENSIQPFSTQCNIVTSDRLASAASLSSSWSGGTMARIGLRMMPPFP